jgi:hypothetical protein
MEVQKLSQQQDAILQDVSAQFGSLACAPEHVRDDYKSIGRAYKARYSVLEKAHLAQTRLDYHAMKRNLDGTPNVLDESSQLGEDSLNIACAENVSTSRY